MVEQEDDDFLVFRPAFRRAARIHPAGGRMVSLRNPLGHLTTYTYDQLDRRTSLTHPLGKQWATAYFNLMGGGTRATLTYPGVNGGSAYGVQRDFDRLGRLASIGFGDPANTPDVQLAYDAAGNRSRMSEYNHVGRIRETLYDYDDVHRLTSVNFDNDGNGTVDETVSYEYDAGGLRTKLTLPGSLNVVYTYNERGELVSLTDWDGQPTGFAYDLAGRLIAAERANGLRSRYQHDAAGRLRLLRHTKDARTLGHFEYQVDKRGNRTQALERLPHPTTTTDTTIPYNAKSLALKGTWAEVSGFKESSQSYASLKLMFFGDEATLTMGTETDHGLYDVYVDGALWQSFDGYTASASQRDIVISAGVDSRKLYSEGPHLLEIRNRTEKNKTSTGNKVRFKQLVVADKTYDLHTIEYAYDNLSRLTEARYNPGVNVDAGDGDLLRRYLFTHDRAGNRLSESLAINGGAPTVTNFTYNAANQMTSNGSITFGYDNNGNLITANSVPVMTWDRANRLLSATDGVTTTDYAYDGEGHRIKQTVGATITKYLLDLQPGLPLVLAETVGANTKRFVHAPMGIHAQEDASGIWTWAVQDALGNVRLEASNAVAVNGMRNFAPYGVGFGQQGSFGMPYGFTGEPTDGNGLVHLRARYYSPALGVFTALDPFEGFLDEPMSLNGYGYVGEDPINDAVGELLSLINGYNYANGNPVNRVDPSGMQDCIPGFDCPAPGDGGLTSLDCALFPNAYGCPGNGNTGGVDFPGYFPDYGDISIQEALLWCLRLNNGACFVNSGGYSPNQVPARPSGQLRGQECNRRDWRWRVFTAYSEIFNHQEREDLGLTDWEGHHGVPSSWMRDIFGSDYAPGDAPVVLMPGENHDPASDLWREIGRNLDPRWAWNTVSWFTMRWIAEQMFQDSSTPQGCRTTYWDRFRDYATHLLCKKALELGAGAVANIAGLPPVMKEMWDWTGASSAICATLR